MSYESSFSNGHCRVERPKPTTGVPSEPLKLFMKFHKSNETNIDIFKKLAPTREVEALICSEYSCSGLGTKVYGFFQTQDKTLGRIDEFLDAQNLEPEGVEDEDIRADIEKSLAVFHAMDILMPRRPVKPIYGALVGGLRKYHKMEKLKVLGREGGVIVDDLVDYDFAARLEKVVERLKSMGGKIGWIIHDVQFMNVMVKKSPKEGESKVVLIDFEFVMRNYRAFGIGGHFMQKMFKWFDEENKIANCRKYTEEEKRHFCDEYVKKWNEVIGDEDTGEQVVKETELGYMLGIAFDVHNMLWFMEKVGDRDPLSLLGLNKLFDEFASQYIKLGLEDP